MFTVGETLKKFWLRQGIKLNSGASQDELDSFEVKHSVRMPEDLRDYFASVNGFDGSEHWMTDENVITFLSLDEVRPVSEYWSPDVAGGDSYFVFADYSISAYVYAIRLLNVSGGNPVVVLYDRTPIEVAGSFSEFVVGYLAGSNVVLSPEPPA